MRTVSVQIQGVVFHVFLMACLASINSSAYAQDAKEPVKAEPAQVEVAQVEAAQVEVKVDIDFAGVVEAVGEAVVEEGLEMADEAVQIMAIGGQVDPQSMKLQSKIAVDNALVRRICKLDAEQEEALNAINANWIRGKAGARKQADNLAAGVLRVFAGGGAVQQPNNPAEAVNRVTKAYQARLAEILKPEQLAEYEKHVKEREQFRRLANAECIVAVLEDRLSLNRDQHEELVKSLADWSGIQRMQATFYFQNQAYIPNLPASVLKALTPTQRKILDGMQKADFQFEMFNDGQEAIFINQ